MGQPPRLKLKSANLTPKPIMRWLIDSDILIEGERGNPGFVPWLEAEAEVATSDIVRAEFLPGVHAVPDAAKRQRGELFYRDRIANLASLPLT